MIKIGNIAGEIDPPYLNGEINPAIASRTRAIATKIAISVIVLICCF